MPHAPFSDHVVGHVPHSTHSTFQHGNLKTAFRVEMHMQRGDGQTVMVVKLISETVRQIASGVVVDINESRHAICVGLGRIGLPHSGARQVAQRF